MTLSPEGHFPSGHRECGISRTVPPAVRTRSAHPPTTPTCLCPWNWQQSHVACILIQKAEFRGPTESDIFFFTRCNLTQEIGPTRDFSQQIMVYFCVCQSTARMCTHFQPYDNYTRKWVHWFFFLINMNEECLFIYHCKIQVTWTVLYVHIYSN